jgi:hypothetical protein
MSETLHPRIQMEAFVAFAVVLSCKCFTAHCAYEWSFVSVGAEVEQHRVSQNESRNTRLPSSAPYVRNASPAHTICDPTSAFVAFAVVLSCKCFTAHCAYEWSFVSVGAEVGSQILRSRRSTKTRSSTG